MDLRYGIIHELLLKHGAEREVKNESDLSRTKTFIIIINIFISYCWIRADFERWIASV